MTSNRRNLLHIQKPLICIYTNQIECSAYRISSRRCITPLVFGLSDYESGFKHGVVDGKINTIIPSSIDRYYIHQPGKGFAFHTTEFECEEQETQYEKSVEGRRRKKKMMISG